MVISPGSSHSLGILVIRHDIAVVREFFVTDGTFPVLLDNFPIQQLPHLGRRSEFPVSSRVMYVIDTLHPEPYQSRLGQKFPATARERIVYWAVFIATKPHGVPPGRNPLVSDEFGLRNGAEHLSRLGHRRKILITQQIGHIRRITLML